MGGVDAEVVLQLFDFVSAAGAMVGLLLEVEAAVRTNMNVVAKVGSTSRAPEEHFRGEPLRTIMRLGQDGIGRELL